MDKKELLEIIEANTTYHYAFTDGTYHIPNTIEGEFVGLMLELLFEVPRKNIVLFELKEWKPSNSKNLKLSHQLSKLDTSNRRKKKALRQADKDLKFLRNALDEAQEENEELKDTIRELRASLDASITGEMLELLDNDY